MMIGIIDYGAGNIRSVSNALNRLGVTHCVTRSIDVLQHADKLILPGVGEARMAMESLDRIGLIEWLRGVHVPFLGICLGMQLLFERSSERATACLGLIAGTITAFDAGCVKVPHMGWNIVSADPAHPLFAGLREKEYYYFVHSYHASLVPAVIGTTEYGVKFASAVQFRNFYGVQFHPEKSGTAGLHLLNNFVTRC